MSYYDELDVGMAAPISMEQAKVKIAPPEIKADRASFWNKTKPSKDDGERWLNEQPFDNLPPRLKEVYKACGSKSPRYGHIIRERFRSEFDKWYDEVFSKTKVT